jgi:hypothetical protein
MANTPGVGQVASYELPVASVHFWQLATNNWQLPSAFTKANHRAGGAVVGQCTA